MKDKKKIKRPVRDKTTSAAAIEKTPRTRPKSHIDYCLTCKIPVKQCKGDCTKQQQKLNGGY